ncbi:MAG: universal stress protein [Streptosporangiaceae bacterium]
MGLDGSLASLRALRRGVTEARHGSAELHAVHVRQHARPRNYRAGVLGAAAETQLLEERLDQQADGVIAACFREGLGGTPADVTVHRRMSAGHPGRSLVSLAWRDDDLIVVGSGERGPLRRLLGRSVANYCLAPRKLPGTRGPAGQLRPQHAPLEAAAYVDHRP